MVSYPPQPAPLSPFNTYTSWPGGVDPTVSVYKMPVTGGKRKASRKAHRKASRKAHRKTRKGARRH